MEWSNGIPILTTWRLWDFDVDEPNVLFPFRELIGALLWIALLTRPDIANAVRTSSFGISFQKRTLTGLSLISFTDADYASRSTDRRSLSGRVVMCAGGAVSWHSKTQKCVSLDLLSTTQATRRRSV